MDVRPPLIAHRQPAIPAQPRQRTLHHPSVASQSLARLDSASGDTRGYAPLPECLSATWEVIAFVGMQLLGTLPRPARTPARLLDRLDVIHSLLQNLRVVDVCGAEHYRERDASSVRNNVALRARFAFIRRIRAGLFWPPFWLAHSPSPKKPAPSLSGRPRPEDPRVPDPALPTRPRLLPVAQAPPAR